MNRFVHLLGFGEYLLKIRFGKFQLTEYNRLYINNTQRYSPLIAYKHKKAVPTHLTEEPKK